MSVNTLLKNPADAWTNLSVNSLAYNSLTQTQINALTPVKGQLVFNSTIGGLQIYNGAVWTTIASSTITPTISNQQVTASGISLGTSNTTITSAASPNAGTYLISYSAYSASSGTGATGTYQVSIDGTPVANSLNEWSIADPTAIVPIGLTWIGTTTGTNISIVGKCSNAGTFTVANNVMDLVQLG